jgi:hypothetical protein
MAPGPFFVGAGMSITRTFSGSLDINAVAKDTLSGDIAGTESIVRALSIAFAASGGSAPTISGFITGAVATSTTPADLLLAHATNIFVNFGGTATYSTGFTVAGSKVKLLLLENLDTTNSITVTTPHLHSFPIIQAADQSLRDLGPGDVYLFFAKAGSAALTTGSNDALTLVSSAGTPQLQVSVLYGP